VARIVLDSFAWVEFFDGTPVGAHVAELIDSGQQSYSVDACLVEIARKYRRDGVPAQRVDSFLSRIAMLSHVVSIDRKIALAAADADDELRKHAKKAKLATPGLFDALVLATARVLEARVVTGDGHFEGLAETQWIGPGFEP
jgi:predicted nucleic acid-binding protein